MGWTDGRVFALHWEHLLLELRNLGPGGNQGGRGRGTGRGRGRGPFREVAVELPRVTQLWSERDGMASHLMCVQVRAYFVCMSVCECVCAYFVCECVRTLCV